MRIIDWVLPVGLPQCLGLKPIPNNKGDFHFSGSRCKEKHPNPKLSAEELEAIAEIEKSAKERTNSFFEMESFLPKKNGYGLELHLTCFN